MKKVIDFTLPYFKNMIDGIHQEFVEAAANNIKVIHVDEAVFTFSTFRNKSWSSAYSNIGVIDKKVTIKAHAIIAGISEDKGLESYLIT